jgi:hypothetical protein
MITAIQEIKNLLELYPQYKDDVFEFAYMGEHPQDVLLYLKNRIAEKLSREFLDVNL